MRALIQRVLTASVAIDGMDVRTIGAGLVVFVGVTHDDSSKDADYIVDKVVELRIFHDESGKMNRSVRDIRGDCLIVSQFTLYGDTRKGRRPSFVEAAPPIIAIPLYEYIVASFQSNQDIGLKTGEFGADMRVTLTNDGPVTFMIDSKYVK